MVEPHVKVIAEQQHIDYQFIGLEDDDTDEEVDDYDVNDDGAASFDYGQNGHGQDAVSHSRMSMEVRSLSALGLIFTIKYLPFVLYSLCSSI